MTQEQYLREFEEITTQMLEVTRAKNTDYTNGNDDAFRNFKQVELMGICSAEQGFLTRMTDKMMRISSFVKNGELQVKDESVTDTLQDLAVYSILMLCYIRSKKPKMPLQQAIKLTENDIKGLANLMSIDVDKLMDGERIVTNKNTD